MALKQIYFVRHGETRANQSHIHQGPSESLSDKGRQQAHVVAEYLRKRGIDTLLCSNYVRARETAEIIGEVIGIPYTITDSVKEFRRPNSLYGKRHFSFKTIQYIVQLFLHRADDSWDNEGAENMFDIRNRILDAKQEIEKTEGKRVAVISHTIFMDMFTKVSCTDRPLRISEFIQGLLLAKKLPNTGIIKFELDSNAPDSACKWLFRDTKLVNTASLDT